MPSKKVKGLLLYLQEPAMGLCTQLGESNPDPHTLFL
jgi:hypothetical protein